MPDKIRLDILITKKEGVSRNIAVDMIKGGMVCLSGKTLLSPGVKISEDSPLDIKRPDNIYVGRGGYKLEAALNSFNIDLHNKICIDIGASTGGFTDCMLKRGASKIYAVDTGTDQLADILRKDERVISMEKTDIRDVTICESISFASVDVSFISLEKIFHKLFGLLKDGGEAVCLIKPQFEAGPKNVGKDGVIKNKKIHFKILENMYNIIIEHGFSIKGIIVSPIKGGDGNIEYLSYLSKNRSEKGLTFREYMNIVNKL